MNFQMVFGIILCIAFAVLTLMHYFVYWTFSKLLEFPQKASLISFIFAIMTVFGLYIGAALYKFTKFENKWPIFYKRVIIWCSYIFINNFYCAFWLIFNKFIPNLYGFILIFSFGILTTWYGLKNAQKINIDNVNIKIHNLNKNTKIAHLTDIHLGAIYQASFVQKIVDILQLQNPDCVVITGDLVDGNMDITYEMLSPFDKLNIPIFYVTGNHESYAGLDKVLKVLDQTKIIHLSNKQFEFSGINFIGIDYNPDKKHIFNVLSTFTIPHNSTNILLYHVPNVKAAALEKYGIDLFLGGHTHGGQYPPMQLVSYLINEYLVGLYTPQKQGKCHVYVSSGVGTGGPPIRLFSNCSIGILNLECN